ncbi:MAG: hypothetical protein PHE24_07115 [Patescibacteria group bacterium]|nr:hypothetical protein [Patescibacteria group bacterium]
MNKIQIKKGDLEILIEGDARFIEKHLAVLKKEFLNDSVIAPKKLAPEKDLTGKVSPTGGGDLLALYQEKKPSTHYDKIALFGYYLNENLDKKTFTVEDLKNCYLELRKITKIPANLEVTIADTIKYTHYIKRSGRQNIELTSVGMNYVLHQLPTATK